MGFYILLFSLNSCLCIRKSHSLIKGSTCFIHVIWLPVPILEKCYFETQIPTNACSNSYFVSKTFLYAPLKVLHLRSNQRFGPLSLWKFLKWFQYYFSCLGHYEHALTQKSRSKGAHFESKSSYYYTSRSP